MIGTLRPYRFLFEMAPAYAVVPHGFLVVVLLSLLFDSIAGLPGHGPKNEKCKPQPQFTTTKPSKYTLQVCVSVGLALAHISSWVVA